MNRHVPKIICIGILFVAQTWNAHCGNRSSLVVECKERGIHSISGYELRDAGVDLAEWHPARMVMVHGHASIPIHILDGGDDQFDLHDRLYFFSEGPQLQELFYINIYGEYYPAVQVYMLYPEHPDLKPSRFHQKNMGRRMRKAVAKTPGMKFYGTRHYEKDPLWEFIPGNRKDHQKTDYLFWKKLSYPETDRVASDVSIEFKMPETELGTTSTLVISLAGLGHYTRTHRVKIGLNREWAWSRQWDGYDHRAEIEVSPGILRPGLNILTLVLEQPKQSRDHPNRQNIDVVLLDWFRLNFRSKLIPGPGLDEFIIRGDPERRDENTLVISGFIHKPLICLDVENKVIHQPMIYRESVYSDTWTLQTRLSGPEATLVIGESVDMVKPHRIRPYRVRGIYKEDVSCALLIITHDAFVEALQPLLEWKRSSGLKTHLVTVNQIFNETSGGIPSTESIAEYIRYVYENSRDPELGYVMLVGDTSTISKYQSFVPSYAYLDSGNHANDNYFATFGQPDGFPSVAIGRISVQNTQQIANVTRKIIEYERRDHLGSWRISNLLISASENWARADAEWVKKHYVFPDMLSHHVHSDPGITDDIHHARLTGNLVNAFNRGHMLTAFYGHGGGSVWEVGPTHTEGRIKKHLFDQENVETLENLGKPTLVLALTCYTNDFDNPHVTQTLGEVFVNSEGGAVAVIGASDRSSIYINRKMSQNILQSLREERRIRLGDLFLRSLDEVRNQYSMYNILGDPSLLIHLPSDGVRLYNLAVHHDRKGLTIEYEAPSEIQFPANAEIIMLDESGEAVSSRVDEINSRQGALGLDIAPGAVSDMHRLVVYIADSRRNDYVGSYVVDGDI